MTIENIQETGLDSMDMESKSILSDDELVDHRFVCKKCGSSDVVLRPFFGSVSRCRECGNMWSNPK